MTIDVLVLGKALGELPEFADVFCARHCVENVGSVWESDRRLSCLDIYVYGWLLELAVDCADLTEMARNVVSTICRPVC